MNFRGGLAQFLTFSLFGSGFCLAQSPNPAKIVSVTPGGVGYVTTSQDSTGVNANIGRWDTPYTGGLNGPPLPDVEPDGASTLSIVVDVNDGGLASFTYSLRSWDAGIYDWYDIYVLTPTGQVDLVTQLGTPGTDFGLYYDTQPISLSFSLNKWKNQQVTFVFSVQQDGYGDQTQGSVNGFAIRTCSVPPLMPITDPAAIQFENGNTVDTADLQSNMQTALGCVQGAVHSAGGTVTVASAFRPPAYQQHLREVWDKWRLLRNNTDPECVDLKNEVQAEFQRHGLLLSQRPATASGAHTQGAAIDMRSSLPLQQFLNLCNNCGLYRPFPATDPVHFIHQ